MDICVRDVVCGQATAWHGSWAGLHLIVSYRAVLSVLLGFMGWWVVGSVMADVEKGV